MDEYALDAEQDLWRRHLYMGLASFVLGAVLVLCYLGLTPNGPYRPAMMVIDVVAIVMSVTLIGPVGTRSLTRPWRDKFFFCWSVWTLLVISLPLMLDGGAGSPLVCLLVLPVLFGGLLYGLLEVIGLAGLAIGCYAFIYFAGQPVNGGRALVPAVMIAVAGSIAVTASLNREIWEEERRTLTERLHRLATRDGLTGCLNYQAFQQALTAEWQRAQRYGHPFGVIMADLDGFKEINDLHGHGIGDATLTAVVDALLDAVRSTDKVGRIGGDEFAVLLPETLPEELEAVVSRIRERAQGATTPRPVTISFGAACWCGDEGSPAELLHRADSALYEAKRSGRDRVVYSARPQARTS